MHNKELFQKILSAVPRNSCCTNAVMQWIAMLGCCWWLAVLQLQPHGSIPWAEGRAAAHQGWGCRHPHPTLLWFSLQGSLALIMTHKPEGNHANWIHRAPKAAHGASVQYKRHQPEHGDFSTPRQVKVPVCEQHWALQSLPPTADLWQDLLSILLIPLHLQWLSVAEVLLHLHLLSWGGGESEITNPSF